MKIAKKHYYLTFHCATPCIAIRSMNTFFFDQGETFFLDFLELWGIMFWVAFVLGGFLTGRLIVRWLLSGGFLAEAFDL